MPASISESAAPKVPHSPIEDVLALLIGTLVISFGVVMLQASHGVTGGTAGLAFLLHYWTGMRFGVAFFVLNLPFYYLAFKRMGRAFVFKTFCAVALMSVFVELHPVFIDLGEPEPFYASIMGNILMGLGFIVLFRHHASLGGVNILALYLQDQHGIRAGKFQLAIDLCIMAASLVLVPWKALLASVAGVVVLNTMIAMNHRPLRYQG